MDWMSFNNKFSNYQGSNFYCRWVNILVCSCINNCCFDFDLHTYHIYKLFLSFGLNAGAAINPARDMAPRVLSALAGWPDTFTVSMYTGTLTLVGYRVFMLNWCRW
jgi:hypothetical protein